VLFRSFKIPKESIGKIAKLSLSNNRFNNFILDVDEVIIKQILEQSY
jgi:hypothetical protein